VRDLQKQELFRLSDGANVGRSDKRGFCFWDNVRYRPSLAGAPQSSVYQETGCGDAGSSQVSMGLSVGWGDIYPASLPDQNVNITGLADGRYRLVVTADADNWFAETNDANNMTSVDRADDVRVYSSVPAADEPANDEEVLKRGRALEKMWKDGVHETSIARSEQRPKSERTQQLQEGNQRDFRLRMRWTKRGAAVGRPCLFGTTAMPEESVELLCSSLENRTAGVAERRPRARCRPFAVTLLADIPEVNEAGTGPRVEGERIPDAG
jgi:hypothetical protein